MQQKKDEFDSEVTQSQKNLDALKTSVASKIKRELNIPNFNKKCIEDKWDNIDNYAKLTDEEIVITKKSYGEDKKRKLEKISDVDNVENFNAEVYDLLAREVDTEIIQELKENKELNNWVETGLKIHSKDINNKCLFCKNELGKNLLDNYSKHFSEAYKKLQTDINNKIDDIKKYKKEEITHSRDNTYADLQDEYENATNEVNNDIKDLNKYLDELIINLKKREKDILTPIVSEKSIYNSLRDCGLTIDYNKFIQKHNQHTDNLSTKKTRG